MLPSRHAPLHMGSPARPLSLTSPSSIRGFDTQQFAVTPNARVRSGYSTPISQSFDESVVLDLDEAYHSIRILIPGAAVELEASGFLTLKIPQRKAHLTTVGKLKKQCLQSIYRKILRCEIAGPTAPFTPAQLQSHFDARKYALTRLSKHVAQQQANEIMEETLIMDTLPDWQTMALMLLRVETEEEYYEAQRLQQERSGPPQTFQNQAAVKEVAQARSASKPASPLAAGKPASPLRSSVPSQQQQQQQQQQQPFSLQSPVSATSPKGFNALSSPMAASSYSTALSTPSSSSLPSSSPTTSTTSTYTSPSLSSSSLDICICLSGIYVLASLTGPKLEMGPVGVSSNWACLDGTRTPVGASPPTPAPGSKKPATFKFLQNIHSREWLTWRVTEEGGGGREPKVEVFLSPVCTDSSRWSILKGKIQHLEAPAFAEKGKKWRCFLGVTDSNLGASVDQLLVLPNTSSTKLTPPVSSDLQICFAVTQGLLSRKREGWSLFSGALSTRDGGDLIPTVPEMWLPRFFVLTGSTFSYYRFPLSLLSSSLADVSEETLAQVEALTAGQAPLVTIPVERVRRVIVKERDKKRIGGGQKEEEGVKLEIEYLTPSTAADGTKKDQLCTMEIEVPSSSSSSSPLSPHSGLLMWLSSFSRKGISLSLPASLSEGITRGRVAFWTKRGVEREEMQKAMRGEARAAPAASTGKTEHFDHDEEVLVSAQERQKIEEQFLLLRNEQTAAGATSSLQSRTPTSSSASAKPMGFNELSQSSQQAAVQASPQTSPQMLPSMGPLPSLPPTPQFTPQSLSQQAPSSPSRLGQPSLNSYHVISNSPIQTKHSLVQASTQGYPSPLQRKHSPLQMRHSHSPLQSKHSPSHLHSKDSPLLHSKSSSSPMNSKPSSVHSKDSPLHSTGSPAGGGRAFNFATPQSQGLSGTDSAGVVGEGEFSNENTPSMSGRQGEGRMDALQLNGSPSIGSPSFSSLPISSRAQFAHTSPQANSRWMEQIQSLQRAAMGSGFSPSQSVYSPPLSPPHHSLLSNSPSTLASGANTPFITMRRLGDLKVSVKDERGKRSLLSDPISSLPSLPSLPPPALSDLLLDPSEAWLSHQKILSEIDSYTKMHGNSREMEEMREDVRRQAQSELHSGESEEKRSLPTTPLLSHRAHILRPEPPATELSPEEEDMDFLFEHVSLHGSLANTLHAFTVASATQAAERATPRLQGKEDSQSYVTSPQSRLRVSPLSPSALKPSTPMIQSPLNPHELLVRNALKDEWEHIRSAAKAMRESQQATRDFLNATADEAARTSLSLDRPSWESRERILEICIATSEREPRYILGGEKEKGEEFAAIKLGELGPQANWVLVDSHSPELKCLRHSSLRAVDGAMLYLTCAENGTITLEPKNPFPSLLTADAREPALWTVITQENHQQFRSAAYPSWFLGCGKEGEEGVKGVRSPMDRRSQWRLCFAVVQGYLRKRSADASSQTMQWPKRYFVLSGLTLTFFKNSAEARGEGKPAGVFPLAEICSVYLSPFGPDFTLSLYSGEILQLAGDSMENCKAWVQAMRRKGVPLVTEQPIAQVASEPSDTAVLEISLSSSHPSLVQPVPDYSALVIDPAPEQGTKVFLGGKKEEEKEKEEATPPQRKLSAGDRLTFPGSGKSTLAPPASSVHPLYSIFSPRFDESPAPSPWPTGRVEPPVEPTALSLFASSNAQKHPTSESGRYASTPVQPFVFTSDALSSIAPVPPLSSFFPPPRILVFGVASAADAATAIKLGAGGIGVGGIEQAINAVVSSLPEHVPATLYTRSNTAAAVLSELSKSPVHSVCLLAPMADEVEYETLRIALRPRPTPLRTCSVLQVPSTVPDTFLPSALRLSRLVDQVSLDCSQTLDWAACRSVKETLVQAYADGAMRLSMLNIPITSLRRALEVVHPSQIEICWAAPEKLADIIGIAGHKGMTTPFNSLLPAGVSFKQPPPVKPRPVMHIVLQSDHSPTIAVAAEAPANGEVAADPAAEPSHPPGAFLTSNDLINHPSNLSGVSLTLDLSEFATWSCTDSSLGSGVEEEAVIPTKLLQDYRGEFLSCANDGEIFFSRTATQQSHWKLHKRRTCQMLESYSYHNWFLACDPKAMRIFMLDATKAVDQAQSSALLPSPSSSFSSPSTSRYPRLEDLLPMLRWKSCHAVIQGELMKRGNIRTPREAGRESGNEEEKEGVTSPARTTDGFVSRFWWVSPDGLSYWRTAADVHPLPPVRTYPYASMLNIVIDPALPTRFDIVILANGERIEFRVDSMWQREVWVQAIANKGVTVSLKRDEMRPPLLQLCLFAHARYFVYFFTSLRSSRTRIRYSLKSNLKL
jgi:hypothetical protein